MKKEDAIEILKVKRECFDYEGLSCEFDYDKYYNKYDKDGGSACQICEEAVNMAIEALSAEAVQVVRCKDCKHYLNEHICMYFSRHGSIETSSDAYCSYGERREP